MNFGDGCLFPTNPGVASSGDSTITVSQADHYFNSFILWEQDLREGEQEICQKYEEQVGYRLKKNVLDYELIVENGWFVAYEKTEHFKIKMFEV